MILIKCQDYLATHISNANQFKNRISMIKPISILFKGRNGVVSQFLMIRLKTTGFKSFYLSKGNRKLYDIPRYRLSDISPVFPYASLFTSITRKWNKVYLNHCCLCEKKIDKRYDGQDARV